MDRFNDLQEFVNSLEKDVNKFYVKDNKAAGVRLRKAMQKIKELAQMIRVDISNKNNDK